MPDTLEDLDLLLIMVGTSPEWSFATASISKGYDTWIPRSLPMLVSR